MQTATVVTIIQRWPNGTIASWDPNPLVDLCVQGELADSIEFVVVDGNERRCFCVLSQNIRLLQTDGHSEVLTGIGVRDGGQGGAAAPPIRAVCRHEFGQRVDIIRAKHNTCLNNTNLGSVTGVKGKKHEFRVCYCS